jgi:hypothetical protein
MATTTPNYGWSVPTSSDYVAQGAVAIETLGDSVDSTLFTALGGAYPGLRLIKKQTIGSTVSSVAVTSAFSSTYDNYKIVVSGGSSSAAAYLNLTLTGASNVYDFGLTFVAFGSSTNLADQVQNANSFKYGGTALISNGLDVSVDVNNPFLDKYTTFKNQVVNASIVGVGAGVHKAATSYTGFTITPETGTLTGGTIYVYGYGAS